MFNFEYKGEIHHFNPNLVIPCEKKDPNGVLNPMYGKTLKEHLGMSDDEVIEAIKQGTYNQEIVKVETHIYSKYPAITQQQDNGWIQNFTTKLVAGGITDLQSQVVGFTTSFLTGIKLNEVLADVDDAVKPMYEKLVKVAVKNEWCFNVIQEGKKAIAENREPVYTEFPKFD